MAEQGDPHGLDRLPPGDTYRMVKDRDGTVTFIRDEDAARWNGEQFVVPDPPPQRYLVTVEVGAIDDPSARRLVDQALATGGVTDVAIVGMAELAETIRAEKTAEVVAAIRAEQTEAVRAEVTTALRAELTPEVQTALLAAHRPEMARVAAAAVADAIRTTLAAMEG